MLIGESNVAIDPATGGGYGVADIYLGELSPHSPGPGPLPGTQAGSSASLQLNLFIYLFIYYFQLYLEYELVARVCRSVM